jgi:arylamine N-acetyltransferase
MSYPNRAYCGVARINISDGPSDSTAYIAPHHMVIFVQPMENSNLTYLVDVGCAGLGPTRPILLSNAGDNIVVGRRSSRI